MNETIGTENLNFFFRNCEIPKDFSATEPTGLLSVKLHMWVFSSSPGAFQSAMPA